MTRWVLTLYYRILRALAADPLHSPLVGWALSLCSMDMQAPAAAPLMPWQRRGDQHIGAGPGHQWRHLDSAQPKQPHPAHVRSFLSRRDKLLVQGPAGAARICALEQFQSYQCCRPGSAQPNCANAAADGTQAVDVARRKISTMSLWTETDPPFEDEPA